MTIHLVTFSDESMERSRQLCVESAKRHGVGQTIGYSRSILEDRVFYEENKRLLDQPRGCGYFAWKPYVIKSLMGLPANLNDPYLISPQDGDIVIYADAGIEFINNVHCIIDRMDQDIFLFGNNWEHAHWCKRDVVEAIWPLSIDRQSFIDTGVQMSTPSNLVAFDIDSIENLYTWARFGKQVQASVIFFRVSDYSRRFVKEWLDWCLFEGGRLIDDSPSRTPNHPEFREHRHDQAILTTMAYRDGLKLHYWPAMYNDGAFTYEKLPEYAGDDYPTLFHHHRRRNIDWEQGRSRFSRSAREQAVAS